MATGQKDAALCKLLLLMATCQLPSTHPVLPWWRERRTPLHPVVEHAQLQGAGCAVLLAQEALCRNSGSRCRRHAQGARELGQEAGRPLEGTGLGIQSGRQVGVGEAALSLGLQCLSSLLMGVLAWPSEHPSPQPHCPAAQPAALSQGAGPWAQVIGGGQAWSRLCTHLG